MEFFLTGPGHAVMVLFSWVPFALAAYLVEIWAPERARRSRVERERPARPTVPPRPLAPRHA